MATHIRPYHETDIADIVQLSLLAWEPVFRSFKQVLGAQIFSFIYPDWQKIQAEGVESTCKDQAKFTVLVAECEGRVVGFTAFELRAGEKTGEVILLAVHPDFQNDGIGTNLNHAALDEMKAKGMKMAVVGTGGDEGHAPARRAYEKAGYTPLPLVRYYQNLD